VGLLDAVGPVRQG